MNPKTLATLEFDKILARLAALTSFSAGRELALALRPSTDYAEVVRRQRLTAEARRLLELKPNLSLGGARDVRPHAQKAALAGVLEPAELLDVHATLSLAASLRNTIVRLGIDLPLLRDIAHRLASAGGGSAPGGDLSPLLTDIARCINQRAEVTDDASPALANLRREVRHAHDRLTARLQHILASQTGRQVAQEPIVTLRDGRYVIPVKADMRGQIPGVVHDVSGSGATVFLEPLETVELGNAWRELQVEEQREVERILRTLSASVGRAAGDIEATVEALAELDLALAKAKLGEALAAQDIPYFGEEQSWLARGTVELRLVNARHPLLKGDVVPISLAVGKGERGDSYSVLLITGPNTGGKTVALKTVGLLSLMAQAGLPVPADAGSRLPIFASVHADIGDEQSIEQSLSTFSSHVGNIIHILGQVKRNSLVLLDELAAGTDPTEGSALAQAILERLLEVGCTTVATTHHGHLKVFAHVTPGIMNASVEFDPESLAPTYRLTIGLPGQSNALAIAARLGMPEDVLDRARAGIAPDRQQVESLLADIRRQRDDAAEAARAEQIARREAEQIRARLEERLAALERDRERMVEKGRLEMERELGQMRSSLRAAARQVRQAEREAAAAAKEPPPAAKEALPVAKEALAAATQEVGEVEEQAEKLRRRKRRKPGPLPPIVAGDRVWLRDIGQAAEALGPPTAAGELEVRLGAFHATVKVTDVEEVEKEEGVTGQGPGVTATPAASWPVVAPPPVELEVRGMRVEEAMPLIEQRLDEAFRAGLPQIRIVHGKGTGTLRRAIREALSRNPLVKSLTTPPPKEGGEGATVVEVAG
jgi:DNA mismatch repair protein MutS2